MRPVFDFLEVGEADSDDVVVLPEADEPSIVSEDGMGGGVLVVADLWAKVTLKMGS